MVNNIWGLEVTKGSKIAALEVGKLPDTSPSEIEQYLTELKEHQVEWAQEVPISERIKLFEQVLANIHKYKDEWISLDLKARKVPEGHWSTQESEILGPIGAILFLNDYLMTLRKIEEHGGEQPFASARQEGNRVLIDSFPRNDEDEKRLPRIRAEIHLQQGTKVEDLPSLQAKFYKDDSYKGAVALVLAAGNAANLTLRDLFHKLIEEKKVAIIKSNPTLEYMGPLMTKVLEPLIKRGFVRIVIGGSKEGKLLVNHPLIDEISMTGSDKTFEAIVFGVGKEGEKNKEMNRPIINKPVEGELGDVSPVIVIPGNWKEEDFDHYADLLLHMIIILNGYACLATRVIVLPKNWDGSEKLLKKLVNLMSNVQLALNYYPGTEQTVKAAMLCYPKAIKFGSLTNETQPLIFATNLDPKKDEVAFTREFWMTFTSQVFIEGETKEEYLENAVKFCNEKLWGTLTSTIFIDPESQKELEKTGAFQKAIDDLHFGNVTINIWPVITALAGTNSEGGYYGSTYNNIQSGNVIERNSLMLDKIEKTVFYAPFRPEISE